ncbi:nuclear transport factor 2 family protein [Actinocorallia populi]|uniref:nuclear transport factor 2 family protein n=1 Tax=Actinocorallia populi TaxID=2079200 RepID=UPI000D08B617|nr:nuclear transport factor 2 family protein [Actinocorallia populi]
MPSQEQMKAALQSYVDGFAKGDPESVIALFAADAVVEDPVGTPEKRGEEIAEFYRNAVGSGAKLTLEAPVRGSHGSAAAMAFTVDMPGMKIAVIDVFTFDDAGKVTSMRAYWGPEDITQS